MAGAKGETAAALEAVLFDFDGTLAETERRLHRGRGHRAAEKAGSRHLPVRTRSIGPRLRCCIAVEDAAIGLRAARAAGIATLVAVSDYTRGENFGGAAAVLSDLGEPDAPAQVLAGPIPRHGFADVTYLRELWNSG
jgi:beta-phosphoglucomutase-like phosphatase (HAD superfamily)